MGDAGDELCVFRHILADKSIASGSAPVKDAVAVLQGNSQPVNLLLDRDIRRADALVPLPYRLEVEEVVEAHQLNLVRNLFSRYHRTPAYALRWGVGRDPFRMRRFHGLQLLGELVVLIVGQLRGVLVVVQIIVIVDLLDEGEIFLMCEHSLFSLYC